jgi:hypothetical protein
MFARPRHSFDFFCISLSLLNPILSHPSQSYDIFFICQVSPTTFPFLLLRSVFSLSGLANSAGLEVLPSDARVVKLFTCMNLHLWDV